MRAPFTNVSLPMCRPAQAWHLGRTKQNENKDIPQFLERMLLKIGSGKQFISYN